MSLDEAYILSLLSNGLARPHFVEEGKGGGGGVMRDEDKKRLRQGG